MILSMTGFGKASAQLPSKKITVELKSLNSKGIDINTRIPFQFREKELELRNTLSKNLERGKIDFNLFVENTSEDTHSKINALAIVSYINQMKAILPTADETELMKMAVRMPDALKSDKEDIDEQEWNEIEKVISDAIFNFQQFRIAEGKSLEHEFITRINNIKQFSEQVIPFESERIETLKTRFSQNLDELKTEIDQNRFEQELIYYLEKLDITEEKVRLKNHLEYFVETINSNEANGRKLGFISQEIGREINTMGSKANHAAIQKLVVQMKDELEKIKEQVLNVL